MSNMKLLKMDGPQCLLYSMAMLLDAEPSDLQNEIEHTGLERVYENDDTRSFHPQEFMLSAFRRNIILTRWEVMPTLANGTVTVDVFDELVANKLLKTWMDELSAVIIGEKNGLRHAATWNREEQLVYDPNGYTCYIDDYVIQECVFRISF